MHCIIAIQPLDRLCAAFAALSRSDGITVVPNWIDIAASGGLARQLRFQRVTALTQGVYVAMHGDPSPCGGPYRLVLDAPPFTAELPIWDSFPPNA